MWPIHLLDMLPAHCEYILFDLGGVILNLDYHRTAQAFDALSEGRFASAYSQHRQDPLFDDMETGRISPDQFRDGLRDLFGIVGSDEDIDAAWNAMLLDIPPARIELLRRIGRERRIFLLSNTNEIHKLAFDQIVARQFPGLVLDELFEGAHYSHLIGRRKPHPETFEWVLGQHGLDPKKTFFIDDSIQHVEGARQAGLTAFHLVAGQTILDLFAH